VALVDPGTKAPAFTLPDQTGKTHSLRAYAGRPVVLYFYPKDDTPGCTKEAQGFAEAYPELRAAGVELLGISKDSATSHDRFKAKYELPFALASDAEGEVIAAYGSWVEKSMYGKKYMGIDRSTFLIDGDGILRRVWRKVSVSGHVAEVLDAARALG
jgi:peroxiredoxin Q/BCP